MRYSIPLLLIIVLLGAGCSQTAQEVQPQADVEVNSDGTTTITDEGVAIEFTTQEDSTTQSVGSETTITEENGIPVYEITLGGETDVKVDMEVSNFAFNPSVITTKPGDKVKVTFSKSTGFHTFTIDELDLNYSIAQGESLTFTAPSQPGQYPYYCDIGSNREAGMIGTLIVQ
jgi:plastocyanin